MQHLKRNLYCLYVLKISHWLMLTMPVIVIFYYSKHLNLHNIFVLQAVYSVTIVILEIPTGYLSDVWGRRNTMLVGSFFGFIGFLIYTISPGFWGFLIAEICLGFGQSFISGTDSALLYDTLLAQKQENRYLRIEGRISSIGNFSEAVAGILGGLLAAISLQLPFICQAGVAFLAVPAAFFVVEPPVQSVISKPSIANVLAIFRNCIYLNKQLSQNILLSSFIGASTLTMAWFVQPWLKNANVPVAMYGVYWAILNAVVGFTALYAFKIEKYLGQKRGIIIILIFLTLGYLGMALGNNIYLLSFVLLFYFTRGYATPVLKEYINKLTPSNNRATVLSIRNFVIRIVFSIFGPIYGWINDCYSLSVALVLASIVYLFAAIPFVLAAKYRKVN